MIPKRSLTKSRKSSTTSTRTLLTAMLWIILVTAANSSSVTNGGSDLTTGVWACNDDVDPGPPPRDEDAVGCMFAMPRDGCEVCGPRCGD